MSLKNNEMANYSFLKEMYRDSYFPDELVKKGENILVGLCQEIETKNPSSLGELYVLTHGATDKFNELQEEFHAHDSEIETAARDAISEDFLNIAKSYGFADADGEELVATRDW